RAFVIASEDFDYDDVALIRGGYGGSGWVDPWSGNCFITPGSLKFANLAHYGNKLTTSGEQTGPELVKCSFRTISPEGNEKVMENGHLGKDNTTVWIGFLVNVPAPTPISGYGGLSLYDVNRQQVFLGDTGASNVWAFERTGQLQKFSNALAAEKVCFLVYRIQFLEGDDEITMWVNPEPGTRPPPEDAAAVEPTMVRDFRFNRIRFCSAPTPMSFDALRFGTSYADIAPIDGPKNRATEK
ncbi:MAG: anchor protein, partial [Verrucomicrobiales bacterium]|nr:anchor protein [Verrucomicrobiales bacterium]